MKQKTEPKSKLFLIPQKTACRVEKLLPTDFTPEEKLNLFSASLMEFVVRMLIEKMFFHHLHIPQDLLLSLVNNLIQTVTSEREKKVNINLYQ